MGVLSFYITFQLFLSNSGFIIIFNLIFIRRVFLITIFVLALRGIVNSDPKILSNTLTLCLRVSFVTILLLLFEDENFTFNSWGDFTVILYLLSVLIILQFLIFLIKILS